MHLKSFLLLSSYTLIIRKNFITKGYLPQKMTLCKIFHKICSSFLVVIIYFFISMQNLFVLDVLYHVTTTKLDRMQGFCMVKDGFKFVLISQNKIHETILHINLTSTASGNFPSSARHSTRIAMKCRELASGSLLLTSSCKPSPSAKPLLKRKKLVKSNFIM